MNVWAENKCYKLEFSGQIFAEVSIIKFGENPSSGNIADPVCGVPCHHDMARPQVTDGG
jgi:hypothetical protein